MTQKYTVPFNIDLEDLIAEDEGMTEEELLGAIKNEAENNHGVEVNTEHHEVTGDIESLAAFFMMLEAGPSFEMEAFTEWVLEEGIKFPRTKSDFPIDVALRYG